MRNLCSVRLDACQEAVGASAACWDTASDEVLVTFGPTPDDARVRLARVAGQTHLTCHDMATWDALSPNPDLEVDRIVGLHYFGDLATTCVVMAGGDIVMAREDDDNDDGAAGVHIEIVGSVDAGIAAARWSPDEEVLALVTSGVSGGGNDEAAQNSSRSLLLMSRGFEAIGETPLRPDDLAASKHVSVGWGKKETQFRGRGAAKAMRDPTIPERVDAGQLGIDDDGTAVSVSWRGDGEYVAVNAVERDEGAGGLLTRRIRVYSREGVLDSISEPVDGLESSLSWRPAGNLVAAVAAARDDGQPRSVVFFERNGLRHGQFALRTTEKPLALEWNPESTALAVVYPAAVQLWTMGNYHWYLKQEVATSGTLLAWHPEKPLRLLHTSATGGLARAEYVFAVARGSQTPPYDHGAVAVIDGCTIKLTPLRTATVPPPMSLFELPVRQPAVDVAFAPDDSALAVVHAGGIDVFAWTWSTEGSKRPPKPSLVASIDFHALPDLAEFLPLQIASVKQQDTIVVSVLGRQEHADSQSVASFALKQTSSELHLLAVVHDIPHGSIFVTAGQAATDGDHLYLQDASGTISRLAIGVSELETTLFAKLPGLLPWAEAVRPASDDNEALVVGLSRNGQLYAGERLLAKNCTSFVVTPDHLVFTTGGSQQLLKFVHLDVSSVESLAVPLDDAETDERCRSIERGARLVTALPSSLGVVLQMPRGNLETVFPRAMVVAGIRRCIDALDYSQAFAFCRTQRVDMNILYDHRPAQFLSHVDLFLEQLGDVTSIDLFLSSLRDEDVSQTMYKDTKAQVTTNGTSPVAAPASKVNAVCDAVLASLQADHAPTAARLQNIITAHVCKSPPALDDGLRVVAQLMGGGSALADRAVEHICFLVDVNRLYDHALGLYDLGLAMAVAQQSQRDPREYVPFLQDLHATSPEARRRFAIDDHLGRHDKALGHLHALDKSDKVDDNNVVFAELLAYVDRHRLYQAALRLFRPPEDPRKLARVTIRYAAFLETQSRFREAGLAYESLGSAHLAAAARCYQSAGVACWRECLAVAQLQDQPPLSSDGLRDLATTLADALAEARDYAAAASVHLEYLDEDNDPTAAVRLLCRGYHFAEAMRVAVRRRRPDLLASAVDGGLADALSSSTELLADCRTQLRAQVPRILELRQLAAADPFFAFEGDREAAAMAGHDIPDDVSVAASSRLSTSGASLFTRYSTAGTAVTGHTKMTGQTGQTTRTQQRARKKREEKKRARGRKGTVYELAYLVGSVRRLVERIERARTEVAALVAALVRRDMADRARAIEALLAELVDACQTAIAQVWPPSTTASAQPVSSDTPVPDTDEPPAEDEAAPVMATFQRLSLLGQS